MRALNQKAAAIFKKLIENVKKPGDHAIFDRAPTAFMALHVECIATVKLGPIISIAHYWEQNGDLMRDPDMTFLLVSGGVYPISFRQDPGIDEEAAWFDEQDKLLVRPKLQRDITAFANIFLRNLKEQQKL